MSEPLQEQLLGYVLGALDDGEQEELEQRLAEDGALRRKLGRARRMIRALEGTRDTFPPPTGLAARACRRVARAGWRAASRRVPAAAAAMPGAFRLPDLAATATVCVVAWMMLLPAVQTSRLGAKVTQCQENLRGIGLALEGYSQRHNGFFPVAAQGSRLGRAGIDAPALIRQGYLTAQQSLVCPASQSAASTRDLFGPGLGDPQSAAGAPWSIPESRVPQSRYALAGSYGYHWGHVWQGRHYAPRNRHRPHFALAADAPSAAMPGHQSPHHAGRGQNVLFENGAVRFLNCSQPVAGGDDFFVNDDGLVAAGLHPDDAVIVAGDALPGVTSEEPSGPIRLER